MSATNVYNGAWANAANACLLIPSAWAATWQTWHRVSSISSSFVLAVSLRMLGTSAAAQALQEALAELRLVRKL